jgi:hypothetical protein
MIQGSPESVRGGEISIVSNLPTSDPPDSFDGIEFRGVGRQEDTHQAVLVLQKEFLQVSGPVPGGIVQDKEDLAAGVLEEVTREVAKGLAVEGRRLLGEKTACLQVERPKVADFLVGGCGEDRGCCPLEDHILVNVLWR